MVERGGDAPEARATLAEVGDDPTTVGSGFARVIEEEGVPVANARGAYFAPRWAVIVCRAVRPGDIRAALRRCLREPDLPGAVLTVYAISPLHKVGWMLNQTDAEPWEHGGTYREGPARGARRRV